MRTVAILVVAYLLGSVPFGYLLVRLLKGADVRETGSGGTGATNVTRRAGKAAGALTLVLDALKGTSAVMVARLLATPHGGDGSVVMCAAVAVIAGHIFPVWLGFKGGKGVATGIGAFAVISPVATLLWLVVFLLVVIPSRFVSLGSIAAWSALPLLVAIERAFWPKDIAAMPLVSGSVAAASLIVFAHRGNIRRLLAGTESKFR